MHDLGIHLVSRAGSMAGLLDHQIDRFSQAPGSVIKQVCISKVRIIVSGKDQHRLGQSGQMREGGAFSVQFRLSLRSAAQEMFAVFSVMRVRRVVHGCPIRKWHNRHPTSPVVRLSSHGQQGEIPAIRDSHHDRFGVQSQQLADGSRAIAYILKVAAAHIAKLQIHELCSKRRTASIVRLKYMIAGLYEQLYDRLPPLVFDRGSGSAVAHHNQRSLWMFPVSHQPALDPATIKGPIPMVFYHQGFVFKWWRDNRFDLAITSYLDKFRTGKITGHPHDPLGRFGQIHGRSVCQGSGPGSIGQIQQSGGNPALIGNHSQQLTVIDPRQVVQVKKTHGSRNRDPHDLFTRFQRANDNLLTIACGIARIGQAARFLLDGQASLFRRLCFRYAPRNSAGSGMDDDDLCCSPSDRNGDGLMSL